MVALILEQGRIGRQLAEWAVARMPHVGPGLAENCVAVGMASGPTTADTIWGVVLFHNFDPVHGLVEMSAASADPRWAQRRVLIDVLSVPFVQYGCRKIYVTIPSTNARALKFNEGIGFKREGVLRHHFKHKLHAVVCGMMRSDYDAMCARYHRRRMAVAA